MKITIEQVEATLLEQKIEPLKVTAIIKDLTQAAEEEKEDRKDSAVPKTKWEFLVVLNNVDGKLDKISPDDLSAWVIQQKEGQDSGLALGKLTDAAKNQNDTGTRKKKNIIKCFTELFEALKPKFAKEKGVYVKTKEPVRVFTVNGKTM